MWYAFGDTEDYQELNLSAEYAFEVTGFEFYTGYTRLEFLESDEHDNEFGAGGACTVFPRFTPGIDCVYATEAGGWFVELSVRSEITAMEDRLKLSPYLLEGLDFGYATEAHDGLNNFQAGLEASFSLTDRIELTGYAARSWAHKDVDRQGLGALTWGGIGIAAAF